ncbi:unnamed protein product [Spirodela intermedia]|uniref:Uncharacterized protein n=1 Tax=Spirodela intermedia TaxID=51605 RepID=A0A7I8J3L4_SPIIN|nr:unnamed protein product [Spirodela intermedia]CAA6664807.1 unnamed protein product [Spirodela intermedia]
MAREGEVIPSSPTISSPSSSDLDTESTGSFFPDRSTTLGTLMGVSLIETPAARPPAVALLSRGGGAERGAGGGAGRQRGGEGRRGGGGGGSCAGGGHGPDLARRLPAGGAEAEWRRVGRGGARGGRRRPSVRRRPCPPPPPHPHRAETGSLGRLPVLLTGICSGSDG